MKKLSPMTSDLYITVARYLLAEDVERRTLHDTLLVWGYKATEEIIFALCSLEDTADAYDVMRPKLVSMLSERRTFETVGNAGIYAWLVSTCREAISACRKKDNALPRALMAMSTGYVRETKPAHRTLMAAGFSREEILYLNSMFIWERAFYHCQVDMDSSPAEHLAADFVVAFLNLPRALPDSVLDYIQWLLSRYHHFDIKLEGSEGLWKYIEDKLEITCPETMLWMIVVLKKTYDYRFDVLDTKWDLLAQRLPFARYHALFRDQLVYGNEDGKDVTVRRRCASWP